MSSIKSLPNLLNEKIPIIDLTYEWILNRLEQHDPAFKIMINEKVINKV
jgi:hypothetical protein